jgi:hypothetical protein
VICQKDRLRFSDNVHPVVRHLHQNGIRNIVGIDHLAISPPDADGNKVLIVIVNLFDKFVDLSAHKDYSAETVALALFKHICDYGLFDGLASDPGSAFMSEVMQHLLKWIGMKHRVSLVDVHTSNGVEPTNREILRHLKALIYEERLLTQWSKPSVLPLIKFIINSHVSSQTGYPPYQLRFGDRDMLYLKLPEDGTLPQKAGIFLQELNENLATLRAASFKYQQQLLEDALSAGPPIEEQNLYQPGDFVLLDDALSDIRSDKLLPRYKGPYEVVSHSKNDVLCRNLIHGNLNTLPVNRLRLFYGSLEEAKKAAQLDSDQYEVNKIVAYRGDPDQRTTMEFEVHFADGEIQWVTWSQDLFQSIPYEDFCRSKPELSPLLFTSTEASLIRVALNKTPITEIQIGDTVFVDLRYYSAEWYSKLQLPDWEHRSYVVPFIYEKWADKKRTKVVAFCKIFDERHRNLSHDFVVRYGSAKEFSPNMTLIDEQFCLQFPQVLPEESREKLLRRYRGEVLHVLGMISSPNSSYPNPNANPNSVNPNFGDQPSPNLHQQEFRILECYGSPRVPSTMQFLCFFPNGHRRMLTEMLVRQNYPRQYNDFVASRPHLWWLLLYLPFEERQQFNTRGMFIMTSEEVPQYVRGNFILEDTLPGDRFYDFDPEFHPVMPPPIIYPSSSSDSSSPYTLRHSESTDSEADSHM